MQADEIKNIRKSLGITQERFARLLNVSFTTINRWEKGRSKPSPLAVEKMELYKNKGVK